MRKDDDCNELAKKYYRVRVQKIEEEKPVDFEWRTDVLYMPPKAYPSKRKKMFLIQIINNDKKNDMKNYDIALVSNKTEAKRRYESIKSELSCINKLEFEKRYGILSNDLESENSIDNMENTKSADEITEEMKQFKEAILFAGEVRIEGEKKIK